MLTELPLQIAVAVPGVGVGVGLTVIVKESDLVQPVAVMVSVNL